MSGHEHGEWQDVLEESARALFVGGAPRLSGETALAAVELLWAIADAIDGDYAAEIEQARHASRPTASGPPPEAPWQRAEPERQLPLELGEDDDF